MKSVPWHYVGEADAERLEMLAQPRPNAELPEALKHGLTLRCYHREPRQNDISFERAVFCGTVDSQLFDWFFNASTGYRGAFFESPDIGIRANRTLVDHLVDFLAEWTLSKQLDFDRQWLLASLSKPSAKAWLAEDPGLCELCAGEWSCSYASALHIENSRWEKTTHIHSTWGRQAPKLTKIRIFGGFIDATKKEWLASHKINRAKHIWEHGWS